MEYNLGGFSITASTSNVMLSIFAIYSIVIVGFGFYIKYKTKKAKQDSLVSFLTGGGGLGFMAIAMIAATNTMAGGTMVSAPGLGYAVGFSVPLLYYGGFISAACGLGSVGRKTAILRARTGAVSFLQLIALRFQSKKVVCAVGLGGAFCMIFSVTGQITSGAKIFAAVTGSNMYYLGMILVIVITVIYTLSGGVKSMARVASIQGAVMLVATFSIIGVLVYTNIDKYGSFQDTMEYIGTAFPETLQANSTFSFGNVLGTAIFAGLGLGLVPHALSVTMTYDNHHKLKIGVIIACIIFSLIQGIMCFSGPLVHAINPALEVKDYTTIFAATNLLPSWLSGIIFCGVFAAIQSSIAGICMASATIVAKDFIVDCCKPHATDKEQTRITNMLVIGIALVATLVALKPMELTQYIINFSLGANCAAWYFPVLFGLYWKKATAKGMMASTLGGLFAYIVFYLISSVIPATKGWWAANMGDIHAFLPAWGISLILMIGVSLMTQKEKCKLGYYQLFFCKDYDERYTKLEYTR